MDTLYSLATYATAKVLQITVEKTLSRDALSLESGLRKKVREIFERIFDEECRRTLDTMYWSNLPLGSAIIVLLSDEFFPKPDPYFARHLLGYFLLVPMLVYLARMHLFNAFGIFERACSPPYSEIFFRIREGIRPKEIIRTYKRD